MPTSHEIAIGEGLRNGMTIMIVVAIILIVVAIVRR